jgi:hypothetical protein
VRPSRSKVQTSVPEENVVKAKKPKKRGPGRPTKYSPELGRKLIDAIATGDSVPAACRRFRVGESTFHGWVAGGEFPEFSEGVQAAKVLRVAALEEFVVAASKRDWRAAFELLKVLDPKRFASKVRVTIESELSDTLKRLKNALPPNIYEQVLTAIAEGTGGEGAGGDSSAAAPAPSGAGGEAVHAPPAEPAPEDVP